MKKEWYESLGALQKLILDFISECSKKEEFEIEMESDYYAVDGYVRCRVFMGGFCFEGSVNKNKYICWHCDQHMSELLENAPQLEMKICRKVADMIKRKAVDVKKKRIEELEKELKALKGK